jgi:Rieske Fe-S protein
MLKLGLGGICLGAISPVILAGQDDPASMLPQTGDLLVKVDDPASKPLGPADIGAQGPPLMAWPMDPVSRIVRRANRLSEILLIRLTPASPGGNQPNAADGVLAYSALCPHAGCDAIEWIPETGILACDCHSSEFDARAYGRVVGGPATRALPPLPLKIDRTVLVVATPFATPLRFDE